MNIALYNKWSKKISRTSGLALVALLKGQNCTASAFNLLATEVIGIQPERLDPTQPEVQLVLSGTAVPKQWEALLQHLNAV